MSKQEEPELLRELSVAVLVDDGVDETELLELWATLREAGLVVRLVARRGERVQTDNGDECGQHIVADTDIASARMDDFHAVVLLGTYPATESIRNDADAVAFIRTFVESEKFVAVLDHGPSLLLEVAPLYGRRLTGADSLRQDIAYAGAHWQDDPVVIDGELMSGRGAQDAAALGRDLAQALYGRRARLDRRRRIRRRLGGWLGAGPGR